jgi:hypothetical protein
VRYLLAPLFIRKLVVGGWVGALLIGPLLTGPWLTALPGFLPASRIRLPKASLVFDTPYCANAEVPQVSKQKIANVNLMCPRLHLGCYNRSGCPELHSQSPWGFPCGTLALEL